MVYEEKLLIQPKAAEAIERYMSVEPTCEDECLREEDSFIYTVRFQDGTEADLKCCGVQYREDEYCNTAWSEMVLFKNGCQIACSDAEDEFFGEWSIEYNGDMYVVHVDRKKNDCMKYDDKSLKAMWREFEKNKADMFEKNEDGVFVLKSDWFIFDAGTDVCDIEEWFDKNYPGGVDALSFPSSNVIEKLCYEMCVEHWKHENVTLDMRKQALAEYYSVLSELDAEDREAYEFDQYVCESGYGGFMYVGLYEFLSSEYLDKEYMGIVLGDITLCGESLYDLYLEDLAFLKEEEEI